ncbi:MAG: hypothetical protein WCH99_04140 [Verrucomicrobiota bacterium]
MRLPWRKPKPAPKKARKPRKAQTCFGRILSDNTWFEQRKDGVYVRRRYGRKWDRVAFDVIRDYAVGQFPLPIAQP